MKHDNDITIEDDLLITIKPEVAPEEEERFLAEFARVILAIARRIVAREEGGEETIEF